LSGFGVTPVRKAIDAVGHSAIIARVGIRPALRKWVARNSESLESIQTMPSAESLVSPELEPGDLVGEYIVLQKLGEGGFGAVYEAAHPIIGKRAAVKVLHTQYSADEGVTSRFIAEARAVNQIRHKNIVDIFSFGDLADGRHYYVMELLEGVPLEAYLERAGHLPIEECLSILHPIAKALAAAHDAGILHRDLKPENIFLELDDEECVRPKVLDFGLAKLLMPGSLPVHKTRSGTPMGSPRYMSPEQCRGVPVDHRTDIYAFGCIAHRMLTGILPFDAGSALELMMAHVSRQPAAPSQISDTDRVFDEPLLKMLEKEPKDRPLSLLEAYESLVVAANRTGASISESKAHASSLLREMVLERERTLPRVLELPKPRAHAVTTRPETKPPSQWLWLWSLVLVLLAVPVVFHFAHREPRSVPEPEAASVTAGAAQLAVPMAAPNPKPEAEHVAITIRSQPARADIYWNGALLGSTPGPVSMPRGEEPVALVVKAAGYEPLTVPLRPKTDQTLNVTLPLRAQKASKKGVSRDLENPY
jgi:eukaryotic-like serine/threonine-protein kinase